MKKLLILCSLVLSLGCAVHVGPVKFAVGEAQVVTCPQNAPPECMEVVEGGGITEGFDHLVSSTLGRAIDAVAAFFHVGVP